jgi:hypothetical protein
MLVLTTDSIWNRVIRFAFSHGCPVVVGLFCHSANYVGFYEGIQSVGAAIMNSLDSCKLSYENEFTSNWVLLSGSLIGAAPIIFLKVRDHIDAQDDILGTYGTIADVLPPNYPEKALVQAPLYHFFISNRKKRKALAA